ncbi:MAG TPA: helix-turn-helix transcriptional regulator [Acidimicrobiales bacterium]
MAELASGGAVSRSLLDERFRLLLGRSPIRYLTDWRMHLAEELLATSEIGVVGVARRIGYESGEAFSRAFERAHGLSPGRWRTSRSAVAGTTGS